MDGWRNRVWEIEDEEIQFGVGVGGLGLGVKVWVEGEGHGLAQRISCNGCERMDVGKGCIFRARMGDEIYILAKP